MKFWIIAYYPWLIILIIIALVIFLICHSSNNNSSTNNTTYNNYSNNTNQSENTSYSKPIYNSELTGFKAELQENTKILQQVEDENWLKEKELITQEVNNDFKDIKQKLLDKAKTGQYSFVNGQRYIAIEYYCKYSRRSIKQASARTILFLIFDTCLSFCFSDRPIPEHIQDTLTLYME